MTLFLARLYAIIIGGLALAGLFVSGHLFQLMNVDIALDILRVALAAGLVYVGFIAANEKMAHAALTAVGGLYIIMATVALFAPTLGGLLPAGLTGFDVAFHLITGGLAFVVGARHSRSMPAHA